MATVKRHVKAIIQFRRATEPEWIDNDPVLRPGESAYSTDVNKLKIGDGVKHWSELEYIGLSDEEIERILENYARKDYFYGGKGINVVEGEISINDIILDCGTSTTNI